MKALLIKKPWIDYILNGQKNWEIRGRNTRIRGEIELIQSGSGLVVGKCKLVDSLELSFEDYINNESKHCIKDTSFLPYKKTFAWVLTDAERYSTPRKYAHPKGAIIWVRM